MKKLRVPMVALEATLACTILLAPCHAQTAAQPSHDGAADLIPDHLAALVRIASIDELVRHAVALTEAVGEDTSRVTAENLLRQMRGLPGNVDLVHRGLPIVFAMSVPRATPPTPVILVPASDPTAYAASLPEDIETVVSGKYVAVPLGPKYTKPAQPSKALDHLPAGLIGAHVDAERLVAAYGAVLSPMLSVAQAAMAKELAREARGIDGEALAEAYITGVRAVLASAKTLRCSVDYRDGRFDVAGALQVKPGSDMDGWSSPPVPAAALAAPPGASGAFEFVMAADWQKLWDRSLPIVDLLLDVYPKPTRDWMRATLPAWQRIYQALGPVASMHGDVFTETGLDMTVLVAPDDAVALRKEIDAMLGHQGLAEAGVTFAAPRTTEAGGAVITDYAATIDFEKLLPALGADAAPAGTDVRMDAMMEAMIGGKDLPMRLLTKDGRGAFTFGQSARRAADVGAFGPAGEWSKPVQTALARVADCNPLLVERFDVARTISWVAQVARRAGAPAQFPELPADASSDFLLYGGIRGDEWRAGMILDVVGFVRTVRAAEGR